MKMKKMLAILAALSVLGTTGLAAGAEDATPTEPATETVTTTEPTEETTETETTVAETTAVEEETVATEENQTVQEKGIFEAGSKDYQLEQNGTVHNVKVVFQVDYETITTGVVVDSYLVVYVDGTQAGKFSMGGATLHDDYWKDKVSDMDIDNYFSVNGDVMNVTINNKTTAYRYDETSKSLVETGTSPTTTAATTDSTTTTTTTTSAADLEAAKKALYDKFVAAYGKPAYTDYGDFNQDGEPDAYFVYYDKTGVNTYFVTKDGITLVDKNTGDSMWSSDFAYFTCNGYRFRANLHTRIPVAYATGYITIERIEADGSLTKVNFHESVISDSNYEATNKPHFVADLGIDVADKISSYFSCNNDMITVKHYLYDNGRDVGSNSYVYDAATNSFVKGGSTPTTPDEEMTTIKIYNNGLVTLSGTVSFEKDMTNYWHDILTLDKPVKVIYMDSMGGMVEPGTTEVIDSVQISFDSTVSIPEGAHITVTGSAMHSHTAHHLRSLVLMDCTYQLDGKTDNGSASNAPASTATKNTSGTPKTGDATTVPAVAVGLTLTAAGVVAVISKRKKK